MVLTTPVARVYRPAALLIAVLECASRKLITGWWVGKITEMESMKVRACACCAASHIQYAETVTVVDASTVSAICSRDLTSH